MPTQLKIDSSLTSVACLFGFTAAGVAVGYVIGRRQERSIKEQEQARSRADSSAAEAVSADAHKYAEAEADPVHAVRIRFVHINDIYTLQNLPQLRNLISSCGEEMPAGNVFVTVGGDIVSPYPLSALDKGRGMVDVLLQCGVRYAIFGNHEADIGLPALKTRIEEWRSGGGVWLNTNIPDLLPELSLPSYTRVVGFSKDRQLARHVCLLGVCSKDPALYTPPDDFGGALKTAKECNESALQKAKELTTKPTVEPDSANEHDTIHEHTDAVVVLTHQDTEEDRQLAKKAKDAGIPLILGGHDHGECVEVWNGCFLAKSGCDARKAVVVDLVWPTPRHKRPEVSVDLLPVDGYSRSWPVLRTCEKHMAKVHQLEKLSGAVALDYFDESKELMSSKRIRQIQTTIGAFLCKGIREELKVDAVLFDGGNIRGNCDYVIEKPSRRYAFTLADLETELPWESAMTTVEMSGLEIASAVRWSRSHLPTEFGGFLQTDDGVETREDNQAEVTHVDGDPITSGRTYRVGIIHDTLSGMNGHPIFETLRNRLGKLLPPLDAARPAKVLLLSYFARKAWFEMPNFDTLDGAGKGFLTYSEVRNGYLKATSGPEAGEQTKEQERGTDVFVSQMLALAGTSGETVSREDYDKVFGYQMPRSRSLKQLA